MGVQMNKYNLAYDVPNWLTLLKPGKYTLSEVEQITGATKSNIYLRLESLEVSKHLTKCGSYWRNVYDWKGASHYWLKDYKKKKQTLDEGGHL